MEWGGGWSGEDDDGVGRRVMEWEEGDGVGRRVMEWGEG